VNFATLKQRLGRRRGFDGNESRLGDFVNDAYMTICGRRQTWSWLRRTHQFSTYAPETAAGTVASPGATFTAGSRVISNMTTIAGKATRSGARLSCPDGTVHRIASHDATTNAYIEANYGGSTTTATNRDAWKIYWDEYPLPANTAGVESIICTGNGFTSHMKKESLLPQHMKKMTVKDYESYPQYYSIERHTQIPVPGTAPTATAITNGSGSMVPGTYKYKYCYFNTKTQELGPFSPEVSVTISAPNNGVDLAYVRQSDFGVSIYRTKVGGSEFFHHRNAPTSDYITSTLQDLYTDSTIGFKHFDLDITGATMGTNIGSVSPMAVELNGSDHIRTWPPPDGEYVIDITYFVAPKELVLDTDVPHIPVQFHQVILDLAESYALSEGENYSASSFKRSVAMEMIERMERDEESDPGTVISIGYGEPGAYDKQFSDGSWPRTVDT